MPKMPKIRNIQYPRFQRDNSQLFNFCAFCGFIKFVERSDIIIRCSMFDVGRSFLNIATPLKNGIFDLQPIKLAFYTRSPLSGRLEPAPSSSSA